MATYTSDRVADMLIHLARERGIDITNLKLQKLLYYAQAWNLVFTGEPLFSGDIEAWVHGPVVPSVFRRFKAFGWNTIDSPVTPYHDTYLSAHLKLILTAYGALGATQLERLTHSEAPWKNARKGLPPDVSSNSIIAHKDMKMFYTGLSSGRK